MFDVGGGELILILLAFLILFGPKKIPEIARTVAKAMYKIKEAQNEFKSQFDSISDEIKNPATEIKQSINDSLKDEPVKSKNNDKESSK